MQNDNGDRRRHDDAAQRWGRCKGGRHKKEGRINEGQKGRHGGGIEGSTGIWIVLMRGGMAKGGTARSGTVMGGMWHDKRRHDEDPLPYPPPLSYHGGIY